MRSKTVIRDPDHPSGRAAVDFYFIQNDGDLFKTTFQYEPYFCIACKVRLRIRSKLGPFINLPV